MKLEKEPWDRMDRSRPNLLAWEVWLTVFVTFLIVYFACRMGAALVGW